MSLQGEVGSELTTEGGRGASLGANVTFSLPVSNQIAKRDCAVTA